MNESFTGLLFLIGTVSVSAAALLLLTTGWGWGLLVFGSVFVVVPVVKWVVSQ